jgi:hypothetical protein
MEIGGKIWLSGAEPAIAWHLDMMARLKLYCSIIFVKRVWAKLFIRLENCKNFPVTNRDLAS